MQELTTEDVLRLTNFDGDEKHILGLVILAGTPGHHEQGTVGTVSCMRAGWNSEGPSSRTHLERWAQYVGGFIGMVVLKCVFRYPLDWAGRNRWPDRNSCILVLLPPPLPLSPPPLARSHPRRDTGQRHSVARSEKLRERIANWACSIIAFHFYK